MQAADAGDAAAAAVKTGRVAKPRVSSLLRHEPAPSAALDHMTEQPGPGHMVMAAARTLGGAGWVLVRPLRPPRTGNHARDP